MDGARGGVWVLRLILKFLEMYIWQIRSSTNFPGLRTNSGAIEIPDQESTNSKDQVYNDCASN